MAGTAGAALLAGETSFLGIGMTAFAGIAPVELDRPCLSGSVDGGRAVGWSLKESADAFGSDLRREEAFLGSAVAFRSVVGSLERVGARGCGGSWEGGSPMGAHDSCCSSSGLVGASSLSSGAGAARAGTPSAHSGSSTSTSSTLSLPFSGTEYSKYLGEEGSSSVSELESSSSGGPCLLSPIAGNVACAAAALPRPSIRGTSMGVMSGAEGLTGLARSKRMRALGRLL
jgi:hypothetical protein